MAESDYDAMLDRMFEELGENPDDDAIQAYIMARGGKLSHEESIVLYILTKKLRNKERRKEG